MAGHNSRPPLRYGLVERVPGQEPMPAGPRLRSLLTLRPYGERLLTPAARVWLMSAWVVVLLMASIEGFVWGAVGASLVPAATPWLAPPVALFMFLLMFSVIWIVDASLIMSERPTLRLRSGGDGVSGPGPTARWMLGLVVRLGIVAISLFVTAPFIEKLIRADDIANWHQGQVEQYYAQRAENLRDEVQARISQRDSGYQGRIDTLKSQIAEANETLAAERERRDRTESEYAPESDVLRRDLAQARERVGDEVLGRHGRPEGYGPEARKWDDRAKQLAAVLKQKQAEVDQRLVPIQDNIDAQQQRLADLTETLNKVRNEQQSLVEKVTAEVAAEQPAPDPPKLTFAARSKGLDALRNSPAEAGVPHFETVEGFAQAALGILFFALIALKLFEPPAVHAYFSEAVQERYRQYLAGGLAHIPGFGGHDDPARRLTPVELMRLWERWQRDPNAFVDEHKSAFAAESRVRWLAADRDYEVELLARRREGIDHDLALDQRRREAELHAREEEIDARLAQLKLRLADATHLQREHEALELAERHRQQAEVADQSGHARRERRIGELQAALDQAREQFAAHRADDDALHQARSANTEGLIETRGQIAVLTEQISTRQDQMQALGAQLPTGADDTGGLLAGWLGRGGPAADPSTRRGERRARRLLRQLERETAQMRRERDEARGRLAVLELERERIETATEALRADIEDTRRRCQDLRRSIDALLLRPPSSASEAPAQDTAGPATAGANMDTTPTDSAGEQDGGAEEGPPRVRSA